MMPDVRVWRCLAAIAAHEFHAFARAVIDQEALSLAAPQYRVDAGLFRVFSSARFAGLRG